ncbi:MAG TPA: hypothetical protein VGT44_16145 [Ktedonobacteraceae bacterium]|nr:hypothetical protein [Ktedonobacteraceae bacterium]
MSSQGNLSTRARILQLFGYEVGGQNSPLWTNPQNFSLERDRETFNNWKNRKRSFIHEEIRDSAWVSFREQGIALVVRCHPDESMTVANLFHQDRQFKGFWHLIDSGIDGMRVLQLDLQNNFPLIIVAIRESQIHSGIGFVRGGAQAYFRVIQLHKPGK